MSRFSILSVLAIIMLAGSCSEEHGSSPTEYDYEPLSAPENILADPGAESITLSWSHPGEYREFRVYIIYHSPGGRVHQPVDTTGSTSTTITDLVPNLEYCFSVSAVDSNGIEGWRSEDACAAAHSR